MLNSSRNLLILLTSCVVLAGALLVWSPLQPPKFFTNESEFDFYVMQQIYDFGYPHERIRTRSIRVHDEFSRKVITVDVTRAFPKTLFHKTLADSLRLYGIDTYAVVPLPDPDLEIHLIDRNTVVTTIRLERVNSGN
ncbi:MAG TPA: hypothetical protein DCE78_08645 [Bacteroidetes bacterium]|nr:hypothetical protein [Bacteroidota bacterium]